MNILDFFGPDISGMLPEPPDVSGQYFRFWRAKRRAVNRHVCLVAHIDTVFPCTDIHPEISRHDNLTVLRRSTGLGADDRAGVFACLELRKQTGCAVLLTDLEERGAVGAYEAAACLKRYLRNQINFFIEIDRRGENDMVYYNSEPADFRNFIGGFGFVESIGSFSDISVLVQSTGIAGVNLSAGYFGEHTLGEILILDYLLDNIQKINKIIEASAIENRKYHIGYKKPSYLDHRARFSRWPKSGNYLRPLGSDSYDSYADTGDGFPGD